MGAGERLRQSSFLLFASYFSCCYCRICTLLVVRAAPWSPLHPFFFAYPSSLKIRGSCMLSRSTLKTDINLERLWGDAKTLCVSLGRFLWLVKEMGGGNADYWVGNSAFAIDGWKRVVGDWLVGRDLQSMGEWLREYFAPQNRNLEVRALTVLLAL